MERGDLLEYPGRYAALGSRVARRADRWRSRGLTFASIARRARVVAEELTALGVAPGERVALVLEDGPLWHAAFFGILEAGAIAVPLDVSLDPARLREAAEGLGLRAWCTEREAPDPRLDLPRVVLGWRVGVQSVGSSARPGGVTARPGDDPGRVAEVVLTSGTSGAPQAVPVTHANMRAVLDALDAGVAPYRKWLRLMPRFRVAVSLPLSHLYGQVMGVFTPPILGADVACVPPMPAPDLARVLRRERAWSLATVPRTLALLAGHLRAEGETRWGAEGFARRLEAARGLPWWRRWLRFRGLHRALGYRMIAVVSGGAALDADVETLWRGLGFAVVQGYGLTETAPLVTLEHPFDQAPRSLGRPLPGVEVRIAPDGEILVRGPNVTPARLGGPAVDAEGWLHTGDLGRWEEGRLVYLGRKGERIVTPAGVNVDTAPIVEKLRAQAALLDAAVLERPWGRAGTVCAVVAVRPGGDAGSAIEAVNDALPDAARIRSWFAWPQPDLPRTRTGKARHGEIRAWLEARAPAGSEEPGVAAVGRGAPAAPADPVRALIAMAASVAGVSAGAIGPRDRLGDVLGSLDRIELATRLETAYGASLGMDALAGDRTLAEVAAEAFGSGRGTRAAAPAAAPPVPVAAPRPGSPSGPPPAAALPGPGEAPLDRRPAEEASWRHFLPVRAARHLTREIVVRGFWQPAIATRAAGTGRLADLDPPFLVAANHLSILDPLAILFALPWRLRSRLVPTAMWEHFRRGRRWQYPLAVVGLDLIPLVQVGDWRPTLRVAGSVCDRGGCPLVFPEGARSDDGELLPFQRGVAVMARELHLPIVPCAVMGTLGVMPRGAKWFHDCWRGRARVAVHFGDALPVPRPGDDPRTVVDELAIRIEALRREALASAGRP